MSVKIGVSEGIGKDQIRQLLAFTKSDAEIQKYTHDLTRFKNLSAFEKWRKGKTIYILTGTKSELLGITWFEKKRLIGAPKAIFTFAIRIYPPVRGRGLAKKFMKKAFLSFRLTESFKKEGRHEFWLSTKSSNLRAIKLYEAFGFKKILTKGDRTFMTFSFLGS